MAATEVRLVNDATALWSMRNSDFDAYSAFGEVVDNSIQAGAKNIKIHVDYKPRVKKEFEVIERIAFGDDGAGMTPEVLHHCMQLGYSSRYDDRSGIGRFGVGMTLAAINQCKRVETYSKVKSGEWLGTYFDLDEIMSRPPKMPNIPVPKKKEIPKEFSPLVGKQSGTLVIWATYDRQPDHASEMLKEMHIWLGRTYRMFIWEGVKIELNGVIVKAIDPLYVNTKKTAFENDPPAKEFKPLKIQWPVPLQDKPKGASDESEIVIRMSLIDKKLREYRGSGANAEATARCIDRNEGVSILRNKREVFYGAIPYWPGAEFKDIDRWWGCEISFDAVLDRSFLVKNIKRGAVPTSELKDAIYDQITPTRDSAVEMVQDHWLEKDKEKNAKAAAAAGGVKVNTGHEEAEAIAAATPTDKSAIDKGKDKETEARKLVEDLKQNDDNQKKAAWVLKFSSQPYSIVDDGWRGPDFIETNHLGGADVIKYNNEHLFFQVLNGIFNSLNIEDQDTKTALKLKNLIDLLLISYSKAEAKFENDLEMTAEQFIEQLRSNWGQYLKSYINTWIKEQGLELKDQPMKNGDTSKKEKVKSGK